MPAILVKQKVWQEIANLYISDKTEETKTEEIKTEEEIWDKFNKSDETVHFSFPADRIVVEAAYKVNVYAIAESEGHSSESKELHEKFVVKSSTEIALYNEEQDQK